jgi:hypothetical protein
MNKEQQELLDEANNNYLNKCLDKKWMKENVFFDGSSNHHLYLKEEFINKCKTDSEFSEKWGLKIEERELSLEERCDEYIKRHPKETNDGVLNYKWIGDNLCTHEDYDKWNIPTKLITITYKENKIESYE